MVSSAETFNASCFSNPWATFGRPVVYEIAEVPISNNLPRVLEVLTASEASGKIVEKVATGKAAKAVKASTAKPAKAAKPAKPVPKV
jgi:hypothetical protein